MGYHPTGIIELYAAEKVADTVFENTLRNLSSSTYLYMYKNVLNLMEITSGKSLRALAPVYNMSDNAFNLNYFGVIKQHVPVAIK